MYCDLSAEWPVVDRVTADPGLVEALRTALPAAATLAVHTSAAVGGARDTASNGPLVEAMEGFGVLRAAALAGVPAIEVRAISNEIGEAGSRALGDPDALSALEEALPLGLAAVRSDPPAAV